MSEFDFVYEDDYGDDYSDDDSDDYNDPDDGDSPLPKTAVYSGTESFRGNRELTEVTFAQGVTSIGEGAFDGCSSLRAITIPDGVTMIGERAFEDCSSLTTITIPDGVTSIEHYAFYGCTTLTIFSLSPAVSIGPNCFSNCTALISAAASQNMPTVKDLLNSRWHRILSRVTVLSCLKTLLEDQPRRSGGGEAQTLGETAVRKRLPKVMWRVILEFL